MVFEPQLALEAVEEGLDPLSDAAELPELGLFVLVVRPHQLRAEVLGNEPFEVPSGEALVGKDDLPVANQVVVVAQQGLGDFAFPEFRIGQSPDPLHALRGADQIQAKAPVIARMRGAVSVAGVSGKDGALDGFAAGAARDRGRVEQAEDLVPGFGVTDQGGDHRGDQRSGGAHA